MRKKKVLVHGTLESLKIFFSDEVSRDYEVVALLSEKPEKISAGKLEVFAPQALPRFIYKLIDGIILTDLISNRNIVKYFLKQGVPPRKLIFWNAQEGWGTFKLPTKDGSEVIYLCGLEFHIRNEDDLNFSKQIHWRLKTQRWIKNLDPQLYPALLTRDFQLITGRPLDFNNLQTFTEKMQWIKIYDATPLKSRLADKYLVRNWVAEKIGAEYLIPLLGVWDNFDDIDFDLLPDQFVLKCNHGSAMNIVVRDKKSLDIERAREKINAWLAVDYGMQTGLEIHYSRIERKIIAEKFISDEKSVDINDYKFWCFGGQVQYVQVDRNRSTNHVQRFYSVNWEPLSFIIDDHILDDEIQEKPAALEEMLRITATLSSNFNIVRVDLYCVEDKVYFGEMTFTPLGGYITWNPPDMDYHIGSLIRLSSDK